MHNFTANLILFVWKGGSLALYIWCIYFGYTFSIAPLIELHGLWTFIITITSISLTALISSLSFFYMPPKSRPSGATIRPIGDKS